MAAAKHGFHGELIQRKESAPNGQSYLQVISTRLRKTLVDGLEIIGPVQIIV